MRALRDAQTRLNSFLWSTEICYGHVLATPIDGDRDVWSLFSHAPTQAWFPNREGKLKYRKKVASFQKDLRNNVRNLHALVLADYYGHFEVFLEGRLGKKWNGSFLQFLAKDERLKGPYRPLGETVMLADLSRLLRNRIAHAQPAPIKPGDDAILRMCASFESEDPLNHRNITVALQSWLLDRPAIRACFDGFARSVDRRCREAAERDNGLTHAFFHALFTFTYLDNLAFEIEEALFDPKNVIATVRRAPSRVRNKAMVLKGKPSEPAPMMAP